MPKRAESLGSRSSSDHVLVADGPIHAPRGVIAA